MINCRVEYEGRGHYCSTIVTWRSRGGPKSLKRRILEGNFKCDSKETLTSREEEEAMTTEKIN